MGKLQHQHLTRKRGGILLIIARMMMMMMMGKSSCTAAVDAAAKTTTHRHLRRDDDPNIVHEQQRNLLLQEEEYLDLSLPFQLDPNYNNMDTCSRNLLDLATSEPEIQGMVVIDHGKIVTEYYKPGVHMATKLPIWSCTKAFSNLLLGILIKDGYLSLDETLGDIFQYDPYGWIWGTIPDADDRRQLTIESIVTMTAGLSLPGDWAGDWIGAFDYGTLGGADLIDSLRYHPLDTSKTNTEFGYIEAGNIISYIIKERTGGMTPDEFAKQKVFPLLGITDIVDYDWHGNWDGVSYGWHGIFMNVRSMAKLGMLYLQRGNPKPPAVGSSSAGIVDESFILNATLGTSLNHSYGYGGLWSDGSEYPQRATRYSASGMGHNAIYVDENLDRILAVTSNNYIPPLAGGDIDSSSEALAGIVSNPLTCNFS